MDITNKNIAVVGGHSPISHKIQNDNYHNKSQDDSMPLTDELNLLEDNNVKETNNIICNNYTALTQMAKTAIRKKQKTYTKFTLTDWYYNYSPNNLVHTTDLLGNNNQPCKKGDKNYNFTIFTERGKDIHLDKKAVEHNATYCLTNGKMNTLIDKVVNQIINKHRVLDSSFTTRRPLNTIATPLFLDYDFQQGNTPSIKFTDKNTKETYTLNKYILNVFTILKKIITDMFKGVKQISFYALKDEHHRELGVWIYCNKNFYDKERLIIVDELLKYEKNFILEGGWRGGLDTSVIRSYPLKNGKRNKGGGQMLALCPKRYTKEKHMERRRGMKICVLCEGDTRYNKKSDYNKALKTLLRNDRKQKDYRDNNFYEFILTKNAELMKELYIHHNNLETLGKYEELPIVLIKKTEKKEVKAANGEELLTSVCSRDLWLNGRIETIKQDYPQLKDFLELNYVKLDISEVRYSIKIPRDIGYCPMFKKAIKSATKSCGDDYVGYLNIYKDSGVRQFEYRNEDLNKHQVFKLKSGGDTSDEFIPYNDDEDTNKIEALKRAWSVIFEEACSNCPITNGSLADVIIIHYPDLRYCGLPNKKNSSFYNWNKKTGRWEEWGEQSLEAEIGLYIQHTLKKDIELFTSTIKWTGVEEADDKIRGKINKMAWSCGLAFGIFVRLRSILKKKASDRTTLDFVMKLDTNRDIIPFTNGCLDFRNKLITEERGDDADIHEPMSYWEKPPFRPYTKEDMVMSFIDYEYKGRWSDGGRDELPYTEEESKCIGIFEGLLEKWFYHDKQQQRYMKFAIAYASTAHTHLKICFIIQGTEGNNGKSTFKEIMKFMLDCKCNDVSALLFTMKDQHSSASYNDKIASGIHIGIVEEIQGDVNSAVVKNYVGILDGMVSLRVMGSNTELEVHYKTTFFFNTNDFLNMGTGGAISARIRPFITKTAYKSLDELQREYLIPDFEEGNKRGFFEKDDNYANKFKTAEMRNAYWDWIYDEAVYATCVGERPIPDAMLEQKDLLLKRCSLLQQFITQSLTIAEIISKKQAPRITNQEFYSKWCDYIMKVGAKGVGGDEYRAMKGEYKKQYWLKQGHIISARYGVEFKQGQKGDVRGKMIYGMKWIDMPEDAIQMTNSKGVVQFYKQTEEEKKNGDEKLPICDDTRR